MTHSISVCFLIQSINVIFYVSHYLDLHQLASDSNNSGHLTIRDVIKYPANNQSRTLATGKVPRAQTWTMTTQTSRCVGTISAPHSVTATMTCPGQNPQVLCQRTITVLLPLRFQESLICQFYLSLKTAMILDL